MPPIKTFGQVWENKGFIGLQSRHLMVLAQALQALPDTTPSQPPRTVMELYQDQIKTWRDRHVLIAEDLIDPNFTLRAEPSWHLPEISKIEIVQDDLQIRFGRWTETKWEWRWPHYTAAFGLFWGLLFHLTNDEMRDSALVWRKLNELLSRLYAYGVPLTSDYELYLALYERVLGAQYDRLVEAPHYSKNILHRPGLTPYALRHRQQLFKRLLRDLTKQIEAGLASHKP